MVAGDSAGGNLAAALTLKLRDTQFTPMPKLQVLKYPALQALDFNTPSYDRYQADPLLYRRLMAGFWVLYATGNMNDTIVEAMVNNRHTSPHIKKLLYSSHLNTTRIPKQYIHNTYTHNRDDFGDEQIWSDIKTIMLDPYFCPLVARDLHGLPDTYVVTIGQDVLRDDGLLYVMRLQDAGNNVTHIHYPDAIHGMAIFESLEDGRKITQELLAFLSKHL